VISGSTEVNPVPVILKAPAVGEPITAEVSLGGVRAPEAMDTTLITAEVRTTMKLNAEVSVIPKALV